MLYGLNGSARLFKVLSGKNRLRILALLSRKKMCVCELAHALGVTQPAVSRHLKIMKRAGLLMSERAGFWTNYLLRKGDPRITALLRQILPALRADPGVKADMRRLAKAGRSTICLT